MVLFPKKKTDPRDPNFCTRPKFKRLLDELQLDWKKLDGRVAWKELDKFLLVPGVVSVFGGEDPEDYLKTVKDCFKPVDHGEKTDFELYQELKTKYLHRAEKMGMTA